MTKKTREEINRERNLELLRLRLWAKELVEAVEALLAHRECPIHSPEAAHVRATIAKVRSWMASG